MANEEVLVWQRTSDIIRGRNRNWLVHYMQKTQGNVMMERLEEMVNGNGQNRGQERDQMTDDIRMRCHEMKRLVQDGNAWVEYTL